jgi:hypothetical protein
VISTTSANSSAAACDDGAVAIEVSAAFVPLAAATGNAVTSIPGAMRGTRDAAAAWKSEITKIRRSAALLASSSRAACSSASGRRVARYPGSARVSSACRSLLSAVGSTRISVSSSNSTMPMRSPGCLSATNPSARSRASSHCAPWRMLHERSSRITLSFRPGSSATLPA